MKESGKELDFLHEVSSKIANRSVDSPISPEEVFDLFKETLDGKTKLKIIELPIVLPIIIEQTEEDGFVIARTFAYSRCKGHGSTEDEAIQKLKEEINLYNKSYMTTEEKMIMEEVISKLFKKTP